MGSLEAATLVPAYKQPLWTSDGRQVCLELATVPPLLWRKGIEYEVWARNIL